MTSTRDLSDRNVLPSSRLGSVAAVAAFVGIVAFAFAVFIGLGDEGASTRMYFSYLVAYCFLMSLVLGSLFFTFIHHLVSAGWSVVVRRLAEIVASMILPMAVLFIPIVIGRHEIFMWLDPEISATDHLIQAKQGYLNDRFFLIRCVAYFAIWGALGQFFLRRSLKQDETGDFRISITLKKVAAPTAIIFAVTLTFFSFDMLMSLDPHWFSTIFGVYYFSGSAICGFSLLVIMAFAAQRLGRLEGVITAEHYMDLGKLMFAFVIFWTYIAFSQYMLYWYGNIPEETQWFLKRQTGEWENVSWFLLIGHFVLPFAALISRYPKRRRRLLVIAAFWLLGIHYVDIYYLAMPELPAPAGQSGVVPFGIVDVLTLVGLGSFFTAALLLSLRGRPLIPRQDPRLEESLAFQNVGG